MQGRKIVVADDEPHLTYMLALKLGRQGMEVTTASDGEEGFELACKHLPALVITDYQMPGADGLELARKLRNHVPTSTIPVLMLTARGHRVSPAELAVTNIKALIPKPFSMQELLAKINEIWQSASTSASDQAGPAEMKANAA